MEGKMKKEGGWTGRDGIYANMLVGRKRIYSVLCGDWFHYTRPHLSSLFPSCLSFLYLCSLFSSLFLFTFVCGSDYSVIPRDAHFIYSRPIPSSIPSLMSLRLPLSFFFSLLRINTLQWWMCACLYLFFNLPYTVIHINTFRYTYWKHWSPQLRNCQFL